MEPKKKVVAKKPVVKEVKACDCDKRFKQLEDMFITTFQQAVQRIEELETKIAELCKCKPVKPAVPSVNKLEAWYEKEEPKQEDNLKMNYAEKLRSATNAIKILPPNLIGEDGRHSAQNIGAICGFLVDEQMMEDLYGDAA